MKAKTMKLFSFLVTLVFISQSFVLVFFIYRAVSLDQRDNQLQLQIQNISRTNAETQSTVNYLQKTINGSHIQVQSKPAAAISSGQEDISVLVQNVQKGVVTIKTDYAEGSGFFITSDGYVVTNAHVLENGNYADVYTFDGKRHDSTLIGYDLNMDIAVLKIDGTYQALTLGNSDNVKVGERAVALGNPYGLSFSVTEGIISARDRTGSNNLPYYFQTDAPLNPGNSGGPLMNTQGQVIGINNFKVSGAENIGFALEINYAKSTIDQISQNKLNQTLF